MGTIDAIEWGWLLALALPLCAIAWIDCRRQIIPDRLTLAIALGGGVHAAMTSASALLLSASAALATFFVLAALRAAYFGRRGYQGLGMGDVKLLAASAFWVGPFGISWLILVAAASALVVVLIYRLLGMPLAAKTRLPFGPHIAFGLAAVLVTQSLQ